MPKRRWPAIWCPSPGERSTGASLALGRHLAGRPSAFPVIEAPYAGSRGGQRRDACVWPGSSGPHNGAGHAGTQRHRRTSRHEIHPARLSATRRSRFSSKPGRILARLPGDRHRHRRCPAALAHTGPCQGKNVADAGHPLAARRDRTGRSPALSGICGANAVAVIVKSRARFTGCRTTINASGCLRRLGLVLFDHLFGQPAGQFL